MRFAPIAGLLVSLLSVAPAHAEPEWNVAAQTSLCALGERERVWSHTAFCGAVRGDLLFGRERNADFALGPYATVGTAKFSDARFGGGLSLLVPTFSGDFPILLSAGGLLYTPIAHRAGADTYGFIYSVVSKKVKSDYGPRFTGGGYALPGLVKGAGTQGGAIVGYEQPLAKKVTFVADWFSGKNAFGYVTPGFSFALPKSSLLNIGYSIGNRGPGNNALFVYYGITF